MSDNVSVPSGSGAIIGADEVTDGTLGLVKIQYVKLMDGATDSTVRLSFVSSSMKVDATASALVSALHPSSPLPSGTNNIGSVNIATAVPTSSVIITDGGLTADVANTQPTSNNPGLVTRTLLYDANANIVSSSVVLAAGSYGTQYALNVNTNAQQRATYHFSFKPSATAITANIARPWALICHSGSIAKTGKIRKVLAYPFSNTAQSVITMELQYIVSGSGTANNATGRPDPADALPTTIAITTPAAITGSTTGAVSSNTYLLPIMTGSAQGVTNPLVIYDWEENGELKPPLIRSNIQEGWILSVSAATATTLGMNVNIVLSEE